MGVYYSNRRCSVCVDSGCYAPWLTAKRAAHAGAGAQTPAPFNLCIANTYVGYIIYNMKKDNQKLIRRLKIIEGQVRGLQNMLKKNAYCIDVITQTSAIKQALSGIENNLMECHLDTCLIEHIKKGNAKKATQEILKVYRLKRK